MNLGENIKKIRKTKKITQVQLANMISKSESTIQKYESNTVNPDFTILAEIAKALECPLSDLLGIENNSYPYYSYYLEDYLKDTGYRIEYNEEDAALFLTSDKECYEITLEDIKDLKSSAKSFIEFKLHELINKSRKISK